MKCYTIFIFNFLFLILFNQTTAVAFNEDIDTLQFIQKGEWQMKRAYSLGIKSQKADSVAWYYQNARETFKTYKKWDKYVMAFFYESDMYSRMKDENNSIKKYLQTLQVAKKFLDPDNILILRIYNSIALNYRGMYYLEEAKKYFLEGIDQLKYTGENQYSAYLFMNLAKTYEIMGDLDKSSLYWSKYYSVVEKLQLGKNKFAYYYDNMGDLLIKRKDFTKAKEFKLKALEIYLALNDFGGEIGCYDFLGRICKKTFEYTEALEWYQKGLDKIGALKKKYNYPFKTELFLYYNGIGNIYAKQRKFKEAHTNFLKCYKIGKDLNHKTASESLGSSYLNLQQYDSALYYFQQGLIKINKNFNSNNIYENPTDLQASQVKYDLLILFASKSKGLRLKYEFGQNSSLKDLEGAYNTNLLALELIDVIYDEYENPSARLDWSDFMLPFYEEAIRSSILLYKNKNDVKYLEKAFEIAEKSKSGALVSSIKSTSKIKQFAGIPDSLITKEKKLKSQLTYYKSRLLSQLNKGPKKDSLIIQKFQDLIFENNRKRQSLEKLFELEYPKYHQLKYSKESLNLAGIQKNLIKDNTTLVEYFMGDSVNFAFIIDKSSFAYKELALIENLDQKTRSFSTLFFEEDINTYSDIAYDIYNKLFKPLNIKTSQVIIIPDGGLWNLNFDVLLEEKPNHLSFKTLPYLIKKYTINYAYSVKLLQQNIDFAWSTPEKECLAFSYTGNEGVKDGNLISMRGFRNSAMKDLPGSRKEIKAVASVVNGDYYFGSMANERNFKEKAKDYKILHLALHGVIDNKNPMYSKLYFTQNKDSLEDSYLHSYELYNLELNAELAVLSACNTGSGKLRRGEGIMSLGRAFTYAGCKSLLLTQWELSDESTPGIMKSFYENLKTGESKAASLRKAKLSHLEKADKFTANPYYWAATVQIGDNKPLATNSRLWWHIASAGLIIMVVIIYYFNRRAKV